MALRTLEPDMHRIARSLLVLRILVAVLVLVVGSIVARNLGEAARVKALLAEQTARLEADIRADCAFKLDIIGLPGTAPKPGAVLVQLAADARAAYVGKHCQDATDPRTGRPFPPPPSVPPLPSR